LLLLSLSSSSTTDSVSFCIEVILRSMVREHSKGWLVVAGKVHRSKRCYEKDTLGRSPGTSKSHRFGSQQLESPTHEKHRRNISTARSRSPSSTEGILILSVQEERHEVVLRRHHRHHNRILRQVRDTAPPNVAAESRHHLLHESTSHRVLIVFAGRRYIIHGRKIFGCCRPRTLVPPTTP
jgi:hypothetical protein